MIQDYLDQLIVVGDRLIIELSESSDRTDMDLALPPNVKEKEEIQSGYVLKVGPGHPIAFDEESEPWKSNDNPVKYICIQKKAILPFFSRSTPMRWYLKDIRL